MNAAGYGDDRKPDVRLEFVEGTLLFEVHHEYPAQLYSKHAQSGLGPAVLA
jgi:hypothetical protein